MKRYLFVTFTLLFAIGAGQVEAQSFLKKMGKAIEKEVGKTVENKLNQLKEKSQPKQTEEQPAQEAAQPSHANATAKAAPAAKNKLVTPTIVESQANYAQSGTLNNHEWVDLGLPSGTRWATCNVDAATPSQPGKHYAWGEIATKSSYTTANNKFYKKPADDFSGDKTKDVAAAKWGNGWRTPTRAEFDELVFYCNWKYVQKGGRWGAEISSPLNGKSIFLPATGMKDGTSLQETSGCGMYWTATPLSDQWNSGAHEYHFGGALGEMGVSERSYGYAVRPVTDNPDMINTPSQGETNGHQWVDLGLPSGTKWATCNVGAASSEHTGEYYAWAEVTPILDKQSPKNKTRGKWMSGIAGSTKYDAATAQWGEGWRIPSKAQFQELLDHCTWEWTSLGRMKGCKVTSKINGNYIFLPASGHIGSASIYNYPNGLNDLTYYSASTPSNDSYYYKADGFMLSKRNVGTSLIDRKDGYPIRPVTK